MMVSAASMASSMRCRGRVGDVRGVWLVEGKACVRGAPARFCDELEREDGWRVLFALVLVPGVEVPDFSICER